MSCTLSVLVRTRAATQGSYVQRMKPFRPLKLHTHKHTQTTRELNVPRVTVLVLARVFFDAEIVGGLALARDDTHTSTHHTVWHSQKGGKDFSSKLSKDPRAHIHYWKCGTDANKSITTEYRQETTKCNSLSLSVKHFLSQHVNILVNKYALIISQIQNVYFTRQYNLLGLICLFAPLDFETLAYVRIPSKTSTHYLSRENILNANTIMHKWPVSKVEHTIRLKQHTCWQRAFILG